MFEQLHLRELTKPQGNASVDSVNALLNDESSCDGTSLIGSPGWSRILGLPAVWNSVNIIAGHIGMMDLELRRKTSSGSEILDSHPAFKVLNVETNDLQSPYTFRQTLQTHALLSGNGRAWIERDEFGQPISLVIMPPEATYTVMYNGEKWHSVYFDSNYIPTPIPFGAIDGGQELRGTGRSGLYNIPDADCLHIPALGWSGIVGYGIASLARSVFETDLAGQETSRYIFKNRGMPSLLLEAPRGLLPTFKEADEFLRWFKKGHQGVSNAAKIGLLRDGITAKTLPISAEDSQFLQSRQFTQQEIALLLGTEYLLGEASAVYKDLAERMSAYLVNTLSRWFKVWTDECSRKLLTPQQLRRNKHFFKFDYQSLLRGTPNTLADYTGKLRQQGAITGNEVRELHGFNTVEEEALDSFDNPNISTSEDTEEPAADVETMEEEPQAQAKVDPLNYHFRGIIKHEKERVKAIAGDSTAFNSKLATYYGKYEKTLTKTCVDLGIDPCKASQHCTASKRELIELAGVVSGDQLKATVAEHVANWEQRAEEFAADV